MDLGKDILSQLRESNDGCRILFLDQLDDRVTEAARIVASEKIATPIVLSPPIENIGVEILSERDDYSDWLDTANDLRSNPEGGRLPEERLTDYDPLNLGAWLLRVGYVDAAVCGAISTSRDVIRAGIKGVGVDASGLVSSYFLMNCDGRLVFFADCAVVASPSAAELATIAIRTADNFEQVTNMRSKVAFLSYSSKGSACGDSVDRVRAALRIAKEMRPDLVMDGELQFDAAFVREIAAKKVPDSEIQGDANVVVFPDLASGNIAYKVAERIGGAQAIGPILQGLNKPWMDLSRGCSVDDIVQVARIAALSIT